MTSNKFKPVAKLVAAGAVVSLLWLLVLPGIARQPAERAAWQALQNERIDPSAMYYTELEAMEPILQRLNARLRDDNATVERQRAR